MNRSLEELRQQLGAGSLSATELAEDCLSRIDRANPELKAFIRIEADSARAAAAESAARYRSGTARALEGLPIAIKDNLDLADSPTTAGMQLRMTRMARHDAEVVRRLKHAGAVIVGKLNMTEAALGADGRNPHFGDCHNPLRAGFSAGGSSSGSAAAVAAGLVPAALGTDTMGSVRIPAAYCGIWGYKPSRGLVSTAGSVAVARQLDHIGVLAGSAGDIELLLDVLAGFDPNCPVSQAITLATPPAQWTLGIPDLAGLSLSAPVARAWQRVQQRLNEGRHEPICSMVPLPALPLDAGRTRRAGLLVCEAEMLVEHAADWASHRAGFSPQLQNLLTWAEQQSAVALAGALRQLDAARLAVNTWLACCDLVILPTTPETAFPLTEPTPVDQADLTCLANCAGLPALSLPLPGAAGELPAGLQLIGRHGEDRGLIRAAARLERILRA